MNWIDKTLDLLAPGWVGSIIGLLGIVAAVVTYFLTRQRSLLAYRYAGERLLGLSTDGLPADITVQYRGQNIPRLTRTLVVFWNRGEKTILAEDVVPSDPLRLKLAGEGTVLAATVLRSSRDVCGVDVGLLAEESSAVSLSFAFLDKADGAVVEVLHTSEERSLRFSGTVRGLPAGLSNLGRIAGLSPRRRSMPFMRSPRRLGVVVTAVGALFALGALFAPAEYFSQSAAPGKTVRLAVVFAGSLYVFLGAFLLLLTRRRYPASLHVEELE
jgi:hypothetical protein